MPLTIVMGCLVISRIVKHGWWRRRFLWGGIILLFIFSNEFIANEMMKAWEVETKPYDSMRKYKVGIVLTGAVMAQIKPDDRVYFSKGADRVVHAVQLYKLGLIRKIVVSGGSGRIVDIKEREADRFKEVMILMGVPDSVIFVENETRNTFESAREVKKILQVLHYSSEECLLITSAFHMRRSLACYEKADIGMDTFSTDFYAHQSRYYPDAFFIPKVEALLLWNKLVKEWVGFIAYWLAGYI